MRQHHLDRMNERLSTEPAVLHESCRFESEIPTAPPAGRVVITFDDGPEAGHTERILEVLERQGVPATFFLIGSKAERHPELVARIRAAGVHSIGNHSWDHPNFHDITSAAQSDEVLRGEKSVGIEGTNAGTVALPGAAAGTPAPMATGPFFRYPYGNSSCPTNELLHGRGYRIVGWHVDSCDWAFEHDGSVDAHEALACGVLPQNRHSYPDHVLSAVRAHEGGIVLMHEIHENTVEHLEGIIVRLKAAGYRFTTLEDPAFAPTLR